MSRFRCPYNDCRFEADSQADVDDHITYCVSFNDPDHAESKLSPRH